MENIFCLWVTPDLHNPEFQLLFNFSKSDVVPTADGLMGCNDEVNLSAKHHWDI